MQLKLQELAVAVVQARVSNAANVYVLMRAVGSLGSLPRSRLTA